MNWTLVLTIAAIVGIAIIAYVIYAAVAKSKLKEETQKALAEAKVEQIKNLPAVKQKIQEDIKDWERRKTEWFANAPKAGKSGRDAITAITNSYAPPLGYSGTAITRGQYSGTYVWNNETLGYVESWFNSKIESLKNDLSNLGKV